MKASWRRRKLALLRISLVKMSAMLHLPLMWEKEIVPLATHSRVEFSLFSIWRLPLVVMLWHHLTQASLSLYRWVEDVQSCMG